jgi:hypothetical protein
VVKQALWLRGPQSPRTGRRGGWLWLLLIPLILAVAVKEELPKLPAPVDRDQALFLQSPAGHEFFSGNWPWFALILTMMIFNTVLGAAVLAGALLSPVAWYGTHVVPLAAALPGPRLGVAGIRELVGTPGGGTARDSVKAGGEDQRAARRCACAGRALVRLLISQRSKPMSGRRALPLDEGILADRLVGSACPVVDADDLPMTPSRGVQETVKCVG